MNLSEGLQHRTITANGLRQHVVVAGSGLPVVLVHGWPQDWTAWRRVIPALAERFTVIAPDLRGLGATAKPDGGYDCDSVAADVRALVHELGYSEVAVAGHDWGAAVAYAYAAQWRDEVRALAFFEMLLPGFDMMEGAMVPQPRGNFLWHMGFQSVPDVPFALIQGREDVYLRWFFDSFAYDPSAVTAEDAARYVAGMRSIGTLRAGLEYYTSYFDTAEQNRVHRGRPLDIPVSAWGGEACLGPLPLECLRLAAPQATGGVIERCGHWIGEERPEFVADHLLEAFAG